MTDTERIKAICEVAHIDDISDMIKDITRDIIKQ